MVCGEPTTISELWPPCQLEWRLLWVLERGTTGQRINIDGETWKLRAGDEFWPHRFVRGNWRNMENPVSNDSLAGMAIRQTISHVNSQSRYSILKAISSPTLRYGEVSQLHYVLRTYCCYAQAEGKPCPDRAAVLSGDASGANWPRRVSISAYLTC